MFLQSAALLITGLGTQILLHPIVPIICVYWCFMILSRLVFHPLASFPGPKLAALTDWYEFYYNIIKDGQYTFHIEELHNQYGPIVRINPTELHIKDSDFYTTIYALKCRDKSSHHNQWFDATLSTTATTNHNQHRLRRNAINGSLSKTSVLAFESHIQASVNKFIKRLNEWKGSGTPVDLTDGFLCYAGDVISQFCFGYDRNLLSSFHVPQLLKAFKQLLLYAHINMNFPFLIRAVKKIPHRFLPGAIINILEYQKGIRANIEGILVGKHNGREVPWITNILNNPSLPANEKTLDRLNDEAITLVGAGEVTIHGVLALTFFYLLQQPGTWKELKEEILTIFPDVTKPPSLTQLEKLPLLSSTIVEGLRLSYGEVGRSPRLAPEPIPYGKYIIPPQTPIAMSQYSMHHNEILFPDSHSFIASRFLNDPRAPSLPRHDGTRSSGAKKLSRYMTSFGKGTRECAGIHLSYAEIYLMIANVIRRCEFSIWKTEYKDVGFMRDFAIPCPAADSKGMRVLVKNVE